MRVGVFGTGDVGKTLGSALITLGHEVRMGAREAQNEKAVAWAASQGERASVGTFAEAAAFGELIVLATLGAATPAVLAAAGAENLAGKVIIDTTNPLDFSQGFPPTLSLAGQDSGGEQAQRLAPDAHVVKAFNSVGSPFMFRPSLPGGPPTMFICGNDAGAKAQVTTLLGEFGWDVEDSGDIRSSRYLEGLCLLWVIRGAKTGQWAHAFKLLRA
jgi:predicted dinucleotide-binding enzyme